MDAAGKNFRLFPNVTTATALLGCVYAASSFAQTTIPAIAWDSMAIGAAPPNFEFRHTGRGSPGRWTVVSDESAAAGRAIEQVSTDATDYRFPLAIYGQGEAKNLQVTVRFKAISGQIDRAGGLALRLMNADNYYVVRANALENNVRFYRIVNGNREQLQGADEPVSANEWHLLELRAEGDRFTIQFNGRVLFTAVDRTIAKAGKVALWTKADSITRFDRPVIQVLP
jgi:hypothetical protein